MDNDRPRNDLDYLEACHAMQTGVAHELQHEPDSGSPKHLRTGLNSAFVNDAAMVRLLVKKGLITIEEYNQEIRDEMNREVDRYEERLEHQYGAKVLLR